jgi:hypothetical protein
MLSNPLLSPPIARTLYPRASPRTVCETWIDVLRAGGAIDPASGLDWGPTVNVVHATLYRSGLSASDAEVYAAADLVRGLCTVHDRVFLQGTPAIVEPAIDWQDRAESAEAQVKVLQLANDALSKAATSRDREIEWLHRELTTCEAERKDRAEECGGLRAEERHLLLVLEAAVMLCNADASNGPAHDAAFDRLDSAVRAELIRRSGIRQGPMPASVEG